jgi:hypothetical protein
MPIILPKKESGLLEVMDYKAGSGNTQDKHLVISKILKCLKTKQIIPMMMGSYQEERSHLKEFPVVKVKTKYSIGFNPKCEINFHESTLDQQITEYMHKWGTYK